MAQQIVSDRLALEVGEGVAGAECDVGVGELTDTVFCHRETAHLGRGKLHLSSGEANANMFVPTVDELFDMRATRSNTGVALLQLRYCS
jgi:hypothetical protein